ncbi:MAG: PEP-CTERM sorting domain-containing protein [Spartobacteria bacterium]|nr:PEP-CTERM sorting domain-containing protein [Spartobacteria bacterium]
MKMSIGKWVVAGLLTASVASANLLLNPGFETGDFTEWNAGGWYAGSEGDAHSGTYGGSYYVAPDQAGGSYFILDQAVDVVEGQKYDASCWMRFAGTANNSEQFMEVQWLNGLGEIMWGNGVGTTPVSGPQEYTQFSLNEITAPVGAAAASVRAVVHTTDVTSDNAWHTFDDFSFAASIPEPTTIAFLGLGLSGIYLFRKKKTMR